MLVKRNWVPEHCEMLVQSIASRTRVGSSNDAASRINQLIDQNREIHERQCFNLNPATNIMNPKAEAVLSAGLGSRPSLGYPGDKYEMGLEAIEEIEVIAAQLCADVFDADYAEIRVASGAMANLYGFMALCKPGDAVIVPPASIGGHVTHHDAGCAGLYGLDIHEATISTDGYTIDLEELAVLVKDVRPKLVTIGGSLNLFPHPVADIRTIADTCGAKVMFDAAHQCGVIAGKAWPNPLEQGAHMMTMSTYKSLGGPAGGLIVSNDAEVAEKLDHIAFPGMTANFDAGKSASLALTMLDWKEFGTSYAQQMINLSQQLAKALEARGLIVFKGREGHTQSHQFAIESASYGGGKRLQRNCVKQGFLRVVLACPLRRLKVISTDFGLAHRNLFELVSPKNTLIKWQI